MMGHHTRNRRRLLYPKVDGFNWVTVSKNFLSFWKKLNFQDLPLITYDGLEFHKYLYSGSAGFPSRKPGGGRGYNWEAEDSDEDHSHFMAGYKDRREAESYGDIARGNAYYTGRDQSFKKLLDQCNELNANMQRAKIILGLEKKQTGKGQGGLLDANESDRTDQHRLTNNYRLYGLHYGRMVMGTASGTGRNGGQQPRRTLGQLHEQLCQEMQRDVRDGANLPDGSQNWSGAGYESSQIGRDFLAGKSFDVGDFEQDLRDAWNFQFEIEQKYMPAQSRNPLTGTQTGTDLPNLNDASSVGGNKCQTYRNLMLEEGVNSNQRVQMKKQDRNFYGKLKKQFKMSSQNTFKVVGGEYDIGTGRPEPKIAMKPLSKMAVPKYQEKLLDQSQIMSINNFDAHLAQNEKLQQNQMLRTEDQMFDKILTGKPPFETVDLNQIQQLLRRTQQTLLKDLPDRSINLNNQQLQNTILLFQRSVHKLTYQLRSIDDPSWDKDPNIKLGQVAGQSLSQKVVNQVSSSLFEQVKKTADDLRHGFTGTVTASGQTTNINNQGSGAIQNTASAQSQKNNVQKDEGTHELFLRKEKAKLQCLVEFASEIVFEQEKVLLEIQNTINSRSVGMSNENTFDPMLETHKHEKEFMLSVWITIQIFAKKQLQTVEGYIKDQDMAKSNKQIDKNQLAKILEDIRVGYEHQQLESQLSLFRPSRSAQQDTEQAACLAESLQNKFSKDLGIAPESSMAESEIIAILNQFIIKNVPQFESAQLQDNLYYDEKQGIYPYALIFFLFACGHHQTGIRVAEKYASRAFSNIYKQYIQNYQGKGLPKRDIRSIQQTILDQNGLDHSEIGTSLVVNSRSNQSQTDIYRDLLVHIMIGCKFRDDNYFLENYLFGNQELLIWVYLKLASFQFIDDNSDEDKQDPNSNQYDFLKGDEPSHYERLTLKDFQLLAQQQLEEFNLNKSELMRINYVGLDNMHLSQQQMHIAQNLFFSGQFTQALSFLLTIDEKYFVDVSHIFVPLQKLCVIKTKFLLTKLLYNQKARGELKQKIDDEQLRDMYLGIKGKRSLEPTIDLVALLGYYINQMRAYGDEQYLDRKEQLIKEYSCNNLTDAVCFSFLMEDEAVAEAFLSQYILNNKEIAIDTLLEHTGREFIYFRESNKRQGQLASSPQKNAAARNSIDSTGKTNVKKQNKEPIFDTMKMTVLKFLGEKSYKRVVLKIVEFNEVNLYQETSLLLSNQQYSSQIYNQDINLLLLDNVKEHKRVLELFNRIQIHNISQEKPQQFLQSVLNKEEMELVYSKKLKNQGKKHIGLVGVQKSKLVNDKIRDNTFSKYPKLKAEFDNLKSLTEGLNHVIDGNIKAAVTSFEQLKSIVPILDSQKEEYQTQANRFLSMDLRFQWLLLDIVTASAKCLYMLTMDVLSKEAKENGIEFGTSTTSQKNKFEVKKWTQQLKNLKNYVEEITLKLQEKANQIKLSDESSNQHIHDRLQQLGALLRMVIMDIL